MNTALLESVVLETLGYAESPGLSRAAATTATAGTATEAARAQGGAQEGAQEGAWAGRGDRAVPHVAATYAIRNLPLAYFARLEADDAAQLWELHRIVWNESRAPLLYVALPTELRIYNAYAAPAASPEVFAAEASAASPGDRLLRRLEGIADEETARRRVADELADVYGRVHLDTGAFWATDDGRRIRPETRADRQLLDSLARLREDLTGRGVPNVAAYSLIARALLVCYLIDRGMLAGTWAEAHGVRDRATFHDVLADADATFALFDALAGRFGGDLFPVSAEERDTIREPELRRLADLLSGTNLATGQLSFWAYDFRYVPIELISGIYDTFLRTADRQNLGAYYTPLALVDFLLEEALPPEVADSGLTVLDPACGSGVFLVRAFQRLVRAEAVRTGQPPTAASLRRVLEEQVYGVDAAGESVRIAAFSLYLAMLDHLTPAEVGAEDFAFPKLAGRTLFDRDFFSPDIDRAFEGRRFDRIIGNLPWGRGTLSEDARAWLKAQRAAARGRLRAHRARAKAGESPEWSGPTHAFPIGGEQAAPAFLWRAPDFCAPHGQVALIGPAKSTVHVTSGPHREFRDAFFSGRDTGFYVHAVVNFSPLVYELFDDAISPAVAVFYRPGAAPPDSRLVYGVPKPSALTQHLRAVILESTDVVFLDRRELAEHPSLWKVAMWGTPRDAALIERLQTLPTLGETGDALGWDPREGLQIGGGDANEAPWVPELPFLPTAAFTPYVLAPEATRARLQGTAYHRPRTRAVYTAPLVLLHQSQVAAALSEDDVLFLHSLTGVAGSADTLPYLKLLVAYVNSPLARYYQFMTSSRWGVERANPVQSEYVDMPFPRPAPDDPQLAALLDAYDRVAAAHRRAFAEVLDADRDGRAALEAELHERVFDLFGLTAAERQLVRDGVRYHIPYFAWAKQRRRAPGGAEAVRAPATPMLEAYARAFAKVAGALLKYQGLAVKPSVYTNGSPLTAVGFDVVDAEGDTALTTTVSSEALRGVLNRLDRLLLERRTERLYVRRHVRVYDQRSVYLVRPSEQRFWTESQARADADNVLAEWVTRSAPAVPPARDAGRLTPAGV